MSPVRYELNSYILFRRNSVRNGLKVMNALTLQFGYLTSFSQAPPQNHELICVLPPLKVNVA
jgi:hypothetical protein